MSTREKIFVGYVTILEKRYFKIDAKNKEEAKQKLERHCDERYDVFVIDKVIKQKTGGGIGVEPGEEVIK